MVDRNLNRLLFIRTLWAFGFLFLGMQLVQGQDKEEYKLTPAPDVWYNNVDGVRLGVRVLGEMEGTFNDGPHRLEAAAWLGTKFPELPVSYYVSFIEPIKGISSFGNEGNVQLISSIRTGYSQQKIAFNKRWQTGFDEFRYKQFSLSFAQEKMFEYEYRPYDQLWQDEWKSLFGLDFWISDFTSPGKIDGMISLRQNVNAASELFTVATAEVKQIAELGSKFTLKLRGFAGWTSDNTAPEYLFGYSFRQPVDWLNNGFTRAQGTLPNAWLDDGLFQIAGGANLRGYTDRDFRMLEAGGLAASNSMISLNTELEFPNYLNGKLNDTMMGGFIHLRSYLFFDVGKTLDSEPRILPEYEMENKMISDAGVGLQFSLNIPDYLGKARGFAIRYEIPFWLSDSGDEKNFKFRSLIGLGAVISL